MFFQTLIEQIQQVDLLVWAVLVLSLTVLIVTTVVVTRRARHPKTAIASPWPNFPASPQTGDRYSLDNSETEWEYRESDLGAGWYVIKVGTVDLSSPSSS